ncbi:MAG: VOC family protein [Pseudomonadota bacterium]
MPARYLTDDASTHPTTTAGVDHLALICSDLERTIKFYTEVVGMVLTTIVPHRDEPTSIHIL